jgi:hypothetical protein
MAASTVLAAAAALYGVVLGLSTYRDSVRVQRLSALADLEERFQRVLPVFARLEDDETYQTGLKPLVERALKGQSVGEPHVLVLADLDLAIRFFYVFRVRIQVLGDTSDLMPVYWYYFEQLKGRAEVRDYVARYYPALLDWKWDPR